MSASRAPVATWAEAAAARTASHRAAGGVRGLVAAAAVGLFFAQPPHAVLGPARLVAPARPGAPVVVSSAMTPWPIGLARVDRRAAPEPPVGMAATSAPLLAPTDAHAAAIARAVAYAEAARVDASAGASSKTHVAEATGSALARPEPRERSDAQAVSAASPRPTRLTSRETAARTRVAPSAAPAPTARTGPAPPPPQPGFFEDPFAYIARLSTKERPPATDLDARQE